MHRFFGSPLLKRWKKLNNKQGFICSFFIKCRWVLSERLFFFFWVGELRGQSSSERVDTESRRQVRYIASKRKEKGALLNISIWGVGRRKQINLFHISSLYLHNLLKTTTSSGASASTHSCSRLPPLQSTLCPLYVLLQPPFLRLRKNKEALFFFLPSSSFIKMNVLTLCRPPGE